MRIEVDWTRCDGHGLCGLLLPENLTNDAAGFPVVDGWYDLVRVDSLAMLLIVVPAVLVAAPDLTRFRMWGSAACLAVSACTKQTVAPFIVAIVVYAVWRHKRHGVWHAALALAGFSALFGSAVTIKQRLPWTTGRPATIVVELNIPHRPVE